MTRRWTIGLLAAGLGAAFGIGWMTGAVNAQQAEATKVYEMRTYYTLPGRLPALNARFRDHTLKLFEKHGIKNVIYLTPVDEENKLVYLIAHQSREAAKKSFADFGADPDWKKARDASEADGKIVEKIESVFLKPTDYSPLK